MTLANKVTLARLGSIPFFVALARAYGRSLAAGQARPGLWAAAVAFFLGAMATDALDGALARRLRQTSALGKILDPVADKCLILAGFVSLFLWPWAFALPLWFFFLVLGRDVVVFSGVLFLYLRKVPVRLGSSVWGKAATALQMLALLGLMACGVPGACGEGVRHALEWLFALAGVLTALSGLLYVREGVRQFQNHRSRQNNNTTP